MVVGPQAEVGNTAGQNKSWIYTWAFTRKNRSALQLITTENSWACLRKHFVCCFPRRREISRV